MTMTHPDTPAIVGRAIARAAAASPLSRCLATFDRYLYLPDPAPVEVGMATVAVNRAGGDPLWLLEVAPSASGKTEVLMATEQQPDVWLASTLTEAALLSGTPSRERAKTATGGLLRQIGQGPATLLVKDFGSVLSMNRESRTQVLAALREVYDGAWTRYLGSDGGRTLSWRGKVGLLGGVTPAIDSHHAVMAALGERFLLFRFSHVDLDAQAERALEHLGNEDQMRAALAAAVGDVLDTVNGDLLTAHPGDQLRGELVRLSTLAVRARSAVERDAYSREVTLIPQSEAPARFALVLLRLWNGLRAIGVGEARAGGIVAKAALDSVPQVRRRVMEVVVAASGPMTTGDVGEAIGYPTATARRACEDLTGHGVLVRHKAGSGKADRWSASTFTAERWATFSGMSEGMKAGVPGMSVEARGSVPETSEGDVSAPSSSCTHIRDIPGKVPSRNGHVGAELDLEPLGEPR